MPRLVHKATDGLSAEAQRVLAGGFRGKKTYRAIAADLSEIGETVPARTIARRAVEWRRDQARRGAAREQVQDLVAAMKANDLSAAEMVQALAMQALMDDPESFASSDPLKVQFQGVMAEEVRLKKRKQELAERKLTLDERRLRIIEEREVRVKATLEKPEETMTPEQRLREIQAIYGIKQEANARSL
jgi:hypothetical protein